jgi:hypothetical protein
MKTIRYQGLTPDIAATPASPPEGAAALVAPAGGLPVIEGWLQTPPDQIVTCAAELEATALGLGTPPLTTEERLQVDTGLGLIGEQAQGQRGAEVLRLCPEVPGAAARGAALGETLGTLAALQTSEPAAEAFQRQAAAGAQAAAAALQCALDAVADGIRAELAQPGVSPEEQAALTQDLRALTVPFEAEAAQKVQARGRAERHVDRALAEGADLNAELAYQETVAALERGESPPLDALRAARDHAANRSEAVARTGKRRERRGPLRR